jgi:DNA-directed RNA polymerase subunit RPC12/RpoP
MTYYCSDCSYRGKTSGQRGECPACGSFNLANPRKETDKPPPAKWRLFLLLGLWGYLFAHIAWKLLS